MRLASIRHAGEEHIAVAIGEGLYSAARLVPGSPRQMTAFIADGEMVAALARAAAMPDEGARLPPGVAFLPVVPHPGKMLCLGLNFRDHARELGLEVPSAPNVFMRAASSLTGHLAPLLMPGISSQFDYEAELAAVIGARARGVSLENALDHVFGLTCFNDGTLRDFQFRTSQWTLGKNFDGTGSLGPYIVTLDEFPDGIGDLAIRCRVNGATVQDSSTAQLVFGVAEAVAAMSACMTLEPGDVIAFGTPPGIGMARTPPAWLAPGDLCEVEIEGVGTLRNTVMREASDAAGSRRHA